MLLYTLIVICICFQAERGIFDFFSYIRLFRQLQQNVDIHRHYKSIRQDLFILIPVLREQEIIEDTILNFCKISQTSRLEIKIAVITTVRETSDKNNGRITTKEVLAQSINSGKLSGYKDCIFILDDPKLNGNMATQLNYAVEKIQTFAPPNTFYMVYNADSIISAATFQKVADLIGSHLGKEFAFQQPCAFIRDMHPTSNQFTNALSLYQSWYCLGHESRLVRNYGTRSEKYWDGANAKLGVIVGHGSGMTLGINIKNNGYPSDLLTEDLTLGFILSANNTPILSLPALELADVLHRFITFVKQKSVWFWNFLGYISCYRKMRSQGNLRLQLFPLFLQGVGGGAYWFFDTFFILIPFVSSIVLKSNPVTLLSLLSVAVFYIVPQYILLRKLPAVLRAQGFPDFAENVKNVSFIKLLPNLFLIILTNSVGAWIATFKGIRYLLTGTLPMKYKTGD